MRQSLAVDVAACSHLIEQDEASTRAALMDLRSRGDRPRCSRTNLAPPWGRRDFARRYPCARSVESATSPMLLEGRSSVRRSTALSRRPVDRQHDRIASLTERLGPTRAQHVFAIQSEVAERGRSARSAAYGVILYDAGTALARRKRPENLSAYDLSLPAGHRGEAPADHGRGRSGHPPLDASGRNGPGPPWAKELTQHFGADKETARQGVEEVARRALEPDPFRRRGSRRARQRARDRRQAEQAAAELEKALSPGPNVALVLVSYID